MQFLGRHILLQYLRFWVPTISAYEFIPWNLPNKIPANQTLLIDIDYLIVTNRNQSYSVVELGLPLILLFQRTNFKIILIGLDTFKFYQD